MEKKTSYSFPRITAGLKRLKEAGLTPTLWLKMIDAQPEELQRLMAAWPAAPEPIQYDAGIVYDAAAMSRILGIPCKRNDPVPDADGKIVVYYGGWDLPALRNSIAGKQRMSQTQNWYDDKDWKAEPGYYQVNLRVRDSNRKSWNHQVAQLQVISIAEQAAPVTVAATALLVHLAETGNDLLKGHWCRCAEQLPDDDHAVLTVHNGRVSVLDDSDARHHDYLWLAASRKA